MDDRVDEDDDDAEEEVASDGCHEGSRGLPLRGGVGSVMLVLWVDCGAVAGGSGAVCAKETRRVHVWRSSVTAHWRYH